MPTRASCPPPAKLIRLSPPAESLNVRVDTGVEEGDEITPFYDPMIAKLIVWDEHRDAALARMRKALADYQVAGVTTNIDFLSRLVACPAFAGADLDTGLIERQKDFLFPATQAVPRDALLVATVGELLWEQHEAKLAAKTSGDPWSPWHARDGWRMNLSAARMIGFRDGDSLVEAQVRYGATTGRSPSTARATLARGKKLGRRPLRRRTRRPPADRQRGCGQRQKKRVFARHDATSCCATTRCTWSKPAAPTAAA